MEEVRKEVKIRKSRHRRIMETEEIITGVIEKYNWSGSDICVWYSYSEDSIRMVTGGEKT